MLEEHIKYCGEFEACKITLPSKENDILKFTEHTKHLKLLYVIYADFETILRPCAATEKINAIQEHDAFSVGLYIKCSFDDKQSEYRSYRQKNEKEIRPATWFIQQLLKIAKDLESRYDNPKPMTPLTIDQELEFRAAEKCHICNGEFSKRKNLRCVRDHCHFSGEYRGPAHNECNLEYQDSRQIPIFFHNLSNYDAHIFIKELSSGIMPGDINVLALSKEKYISFVKKIQECTISFRFLDSYCFLTASLDTSASTLTTKPILESFFNENGYNADQRRLASKKGVFPYEYITNFNKLEATELPPIEEFYSSLTDSTVSEKDYKHAVDVWEHFNTTNIGEYSDLYLKIDVLLLADVFETFRHNCLKYYKLDSAHYCTLPSFTWSAMLKETEVELELLTDMDMMLFIERGIRGGLTQVSNRYAASNNKYMSEGYNPDETDKYLMYFDVKNLYGYAMSQPLPCNGFKWVEKEEISLENCLNPSSEDVGYILEVDLEYPQEYHDEHSDLPFCPEHRIPPDAKTKKLMTTLLKKKNTLFITKR
uniref:DNA-directed DNA polymerase n=1 Tax=Trichogramma kaykai TaxID=54128 RepID=A0ABD2WCX1_9HYME